jgi:putative aldouronate transport system permease protein
VLTQPEFRNAFSITVFVTLIGTAIAMFLTTSAAYPLSQAGAARRKFFLYIFVFVMLFNAGNVANYILYRSLKLTNTIWAWFSRARFPSSTSLS